MTESTTRRWTGLLERADRRAPVLALAAALIVYAILLWTEKWIADDGYIYLA